MSELNVYHHELRPNEYAEFYLKYQADKVIAELEERIADGDKDFEMAEHQNERLLKIVRHHKYKRCLDNAWGCQQRMELFHELALQEARTIALTNEAALQEYRSKRERAAKWRKRWLELAKKFKEVK